MAKGKNSFYSYEGEINEYYMPHGRGKKVWVDGRIFEGIFSNSALISGKITHPDGTIWEGEFAKNRLVKGTITHPDGSVEVVSNIKP